MAESPAASALKKSSDVCELDFMKTTCPSLSTSAYDSLMSPPEIRVLLLTEMPEPKRDDSASDRDLK